MAYVKLAPLAAVFLLATFLMIPMNKGDNPDCSGACSPFEMPPCRSTHCRCVPAALFAGFCIHPTGADMKMVEEHLYLCQSHADCVKKGSGSFCARYPNPDIQYGWCFASNSEAGDFFKIIYNSEAKGFLKMPAAIAT